MEGEGGVRIGGEPKETSFQKLVGLELRFSKIEEAEDDEDIREELKLIQTQLAELESGIKASFPKGDESGGALVLERFNDLRGKLEKKSS